MSKINPSKMLQEQCLREVEKVLELHGSRVVRKELRIGDDTGPYHIISFIFNGETHCVEIYREGPVMIQGDRLFEPQEREEFKDDVTLATSFARRLDRYLRSEEW